MIPNARSLLIVTTRQAVMEPDEVNENPSSPRAKVPTPLGWLMIARPDTARRCGVEGSFALHNHTIQNRGGLPSSSTPDGHRWAGKSRLVRIGLLAPGISMQ